MRALCWEGADALAVRRVPDPELRNAHDMIVRVRRSVTCGGDLPLLAGRIPEAAAGEVLGHEFVGDVVEVGPDVRRHRVADRVVVGASVACGACWFCRQGLLACCDNGTSGGAAEPEWGPPTAGCYGRPARLGGFAGGHAEFVRVPYADVGAFAVPAGVDDDRAVFAADAAPSAWHGAELGGIGPGDVVAVWGAGAVGQLTAGAAVARGAARVVVVDEHDDRLRMVTRNPGVEALNHRYVDVLAELRERSGGRGPDVCVDAAGPPAGPTRWPTGEPDGGVALREAVHACRKGGTVVVLDGGAGFVDRFPVGAVAEKGLVVRGGRRAGPGAIPELLDRMARDELVTEHLATHRLPLERGADGYALFRDRADGCVRVVFTP
ncbi:glutathione-dependent formaldehyde dehydrogenase [Micromonospora sp. WMMA2032]|uniref:alcohol dehydrogenase catalytic domain-containing protein n=1 Tax=Micromonospora TaxID=1873 RepID=UPI000C059E85|nr:alcohol dehydrogenase catalytic domain-containing protein [Micromonospora sp. WMMA2032]ATO17027.1 glutathione-dependent formaldehyde dehydrogenase [Micromonospora sp. WMMA2032]